MAEVSKYDANFVVLRGLKEGNCFWTTYRFGDDVEYLSDGTKAYKVIAYTKTAEEAKKIWASKFLYC